MNDVILLAQIIAFLMSVLYGAALCILYDVMRLMHRKGVRSTVAVFFLDILFWLAAAAATFSLALLYAACHMRFYLVAGELIGFVIFRLLLSDVFLKIAEGVVSVAMFAANLVLKPLKYLAGLLETAAVSAFRRAAAVFSRLFLSVLKKIKKSHAFSAKNA